MSRIGYLGWLASIVLLGDASDETYECSMKNGKKRGHGSFSTHEGDTYVGDLTEGKPHGKGLYKYADGAQYEGQFTEGKKHGIGRYEWPNGDVFEGQCYFCCKLPWF